MSGNGNVRAYSGKIDFKVTPLSLSHLPEASPAWLRVAVIGALALHIGAGSVAIVCGYGAMLVRKGGGRHRAFGIAFVLSMMMMAMMATLLAVQIGQRGNVAAGLLFFYLVASAWMTVRRPPRTVGRFERGALLFVLALVGLELGFALQAWLAPHHRLDGYPMGPYLALAVLTGFFAYGDVRLLRRGGLDGKARLTRHVGRMGFAFFAAAAFLFLGPRKIMPAWTHGSPLFLLLGFAPLALTIFWLVRLRRGRAPAVARA
jgi:hypothetical protein